MTEQDNQMRIILNEVRSLGIADYDADDFPRTQKEAEARVWQCLLYYVTQGGVEDEVVWYGNWSDAQKERWQKAEVNVCKQLQTRITNKAERLAAGPPTLFGGE